MTRRRIRLRLDAAEGPEDLLVMTASDASAGAYSVAWRGTTTMAELVALPDGRLSVLFDDGRQLCSRVAASDENVVLSTPRGTVHVPIADPRRHRPGSQDVRPETGREEVRALMPGRVLEVSVREGDLVPAGAVLLVLEAMKMQNEIRASRAGRVVQVAVTAKQAVDGGALMVILDEPEAPAP
jgi:biotin carboxyl carrier protein